MSFASRLEGLLQQVGLSGVVEEVRSRLGYTRPQPPPSRNGATHAAPPPVARKEAPAAAPAPPGVAEPTRVERTPRPRPVAEAEAEPLPLEASAPEAPAPRAAKAKKARTATKAPKVKVASAKAPKAKASGKSPTRSKAREKKPEASAADSHQAVGQLVDALRAHPRHEELRAAGKLKDQLVRSLIPLYLARAMELDMEVTSGTTSRFWGELGISYAAPNAAKALRLHAGYAQDTKKGKAITPKGVQYVEETLKKQREGASA
ncbi:hypothetical protein MYSTI_06392 [Myxococcus stipitatus DSM 14675]|uniref:Uncharacterized protein n=1 Tax=Myxococcus stipitatus (strain DSM 14675 / JCM 12634 / Mx s8) TaxID=1278073 RepID=L7UIF4_MYXSD|nr:hypothetical protein [Myxococcus stipitatus]AGC47665.1 hypothetical protein MYSTI_06392 [Myxococcus stipitatus DSM 14675]